MRRRWYLLLLPVTVLLAAILISQKTAWERNETPLERTTLIVATDLHYIAPELTDHGPYFQQVIENADGKVTQYSEELTDAFLSQVIAASPDALILSGDLTFNGAEESHAALAEKLRSVADAGIPVVVIPGNHDLDNTQAASFYGDDYQLVESVSQERFQEIYRPFGYEQALAVEESSGSYLYQLSPGLRLLMVNANTLEAPGGVTDTTLAWIGARLREAATQKQRVIAVSHQTLLPHNSLFTSGFVMDGHDKLLALYQKCGVLCNLSGHMHIQHTAVNGLPEIVTSSLAVSPNQYGVLILDGMTAHYETKAVDVSQWARAREYTDSALLNFDQTAADFFLETSRRQAQAALEGSADTDILADFFAQVNIAYFAGSMDQIDPENTLFERWQKHGNFLSAYLSSVQREAGKNHQTFDFHF